MANVLTIPNLESDPRASFEFYDGIILDQINHVQPQRQGYTEEEFGEAIASSNVASTDVVDQGRKLRIPHLATIQSLSWLNDSFYKGKFPGQYDDALLHFDALPGIRPGEEVVNRLTELASRNGVLVFDYSDHDPEYPTRVHQTLYQAGVSTGEIEELGTQSYYEGQTELKQEGRLRRKRPLNLFGAFQDMQVSGEFDQASFQNGPSFHQRVSPEIATILNAFYIKAFEVINDHPCKQGLSPDEFLDMVVDDKEIVTALYSQDGVPVNFMMLSAQLGKFSWLNAEYFKQKYSDRSANDQVVYFPALATDPDVEKAAAYSMQVIALIDKALEHGDNEIIVAFDCCDLNSTFLPQYIEKVINQTPELRVSLARTALQRYCALPLALTS